jgi:hypothetical protein
MNINISNEKINIKIIMNKRKIDITNEKININSDLGSAGWRYEPKLDSWSAKFLGGGVTRACNRDWPISK